MRKQVPVSGQIRRLLFMSCLAAHLLVLNTQAQVRFFSRFGSALEEEGRALCQMSNGNYLIAGSVNGSGVQQTDASLALCDSLGHPLAQKKLGGILSEMINGACSLSDTTAVLAGFTNTYGSGGFDAWIIKVDKNAEVIWQKTFGGNDWDFAHSVIATPDGNLLISGGSFSFSKGQSDGFLLKMDTNGQVIWFKNYGGKRHDEFRKAIALKNGGFAAVGTTRSYGDTLGNLWLCLFDAQGDSLKFINTGGPGADNGLCLAESSSGVFYAGGSRLDTAVKHQDAWLIKFSAGLNVLWEKKMGLALEDEQIHDLKASALNSQQVVFAYTTKENQGFGKDPMMLLNDSLGVYAGGGYLGSDKDEEITAIINTRDKGYAMVGYTHGFSATSRDFYLIKFDSLMNPGVYSDVVSRKAGPGQEFEVWPNPFKQRLNLSALSGMRSCKIELRDALGQAVYAGNFDTCENIHIDTSALNAGFYFLFVNGDGNRKIFKLWKQ